MTTPPPPPEWVWQLFYGPKATAIAAKATIDDDMRAGAWVPIKGAPPIQMDDGDTQAMFAVQTRPHNPIPTPAGLLQTVPAIAGRMLNA